VAADVLFDDNADCMVNDFRSTEPGRAYLPEDPSARHRIDLNHVTFTVLNT